MTAGSSIAPQIIQLQPQQMMTSQQAPPPGGIQVAKPLKRFSTSGMTISGSQCDLVAECSDPILLVVFYDVTVCSFAERDIGKWFLQVGTTGVNVIAGSASKRDL